MAFASATPTPTLTLTLTLVSCLLLPSSCSAADGSFDIRRHLSTVTRYETRKDAKRNLAVYQPSAIPDGCATFHLNLVVSRASASAVAFGIGLFSGKGTLGPGRHRAFSVISESRASDIWLRFHDNCETYKAYRRSQEPAVDKLKEPILNEITSGLVSRYQLNFTREDVATLWFLCKQEASLLQITDQACGLFSAYEVFLLEWTDDLEVFLLKGYGNSINYGNIFT